MRVDNKIWIACTVLVAIVTVALGWFLGIAPKFDEIAANTEQRAAVDADNVVHENTLATLRKEYEQFDELKAELEELRLAIPVDDDLSTFIGELNELEQRSGVVLTELSSTDGEPFVVEQSEAPEGDAAEGDVASSPSTLVNEENFVVINIAITVAGTHSQVLDFVDELQGGTRLFLVTGLTIAQDEGDIFSGAIRGLVYVLLDSSQPDEEDADTETEAETETDAP